MAAAKPVVVIFNAQSSLGAFIRDELRASFDDKVTMRLVYKNKSEMAEAKASLGEELEGGLRDVEITYGLIDKGLAGPSWEDVFKNAVAAAYTTDDGYHPKRVQHAKDFVELCMKNGVRHLVLDSICGAEKEATFYQKEYNEIETFAMKRRGRAVTVKMGDRGQLKFAPTFCRRPHYFQHFYYTMSFLKHDKKLFYPLEEGELQHVDMSDVAKVMANVLVNPEPHDGKTYNLIGDVQAGNMLASAISMKAGVQCAYESVPDDVAAHAFTKLGAPKEVANGDVEMLKFIREGGLADVGTGDFETVTGSQPRRFGAFVKEDFKPILAA